MKTNFALVFIFLLVIYRCQNSSTRTGVAKNNDPLVFVIGFDRSLSMGSASVADTSDIRRICEVLLQYGQAVTLGFEVIGEPSDRKFLRLDLMAQAKKKTASLSRLAVISDSNALILAKNRRGIEVFIRDCQQRLDEASENSRYTDLNGFLSQSETFISERQLLGYRKMILCNSDGKHDTAAAGAAWSRNMNTRCPEWPSSCAFYVCNWKADTTGCGIDGVFESMEGFHHFFQQQY